MDFQKRVKDVSQVFDSQWNVNHDYSEKQKFLDQRKKHFNKMYDIQEKEDHKRKILYASSVEGKVERLNQKIDAMNANERFARRNDFKNNFK